MTVFLWCDVTQAKITFIATPINSLLYHMMMDLTVSRLNAWPVLIPCVTVANVAYMALKGNWLDV